MVAGIILLPERRADEGQMMHVVKGRRDGDAFAARRELLSLFIKAVRQLPAGWYPGVKDDRFKKSAAVTLSAMITLQGLACFAKDIADEDGIEFEYATVYQTIMLATLPNRRRADLRHLRILREQAQQAAEDAARYAAEIGVKLPESGPMRTEAPTRPRRESRRSASRKGK